MKILWVSNHPESHSGYGSQTRQVGRRLLAAGYDVEFSANDGRRGGRWEGAIIRGAGADRYSRDKVADDLARSGADWTIILYDPWVYTQQAGDPFADNPHVAAWTPVDHFPVPPSMVPWIGQHIAIAMSQFGFESLRATSEVMGQRFGHSFPVYYAPHAIEPVFRPVDGAPARAAMRDSRGDKPSPVPEDAYLVGIVAANTGTAIYDRKGFGDMAKALGVFMNRHADVHLYLHTLLVGYQGIDFNVLFRAYDIDMERVHAVDQYALKAGAEYSDGPPIDDEVMAGIYSSLDVLLATSRGEGFGLPVLEAQACGCPVIVSNWTAQAELVGKVWAPDEGRAFKAPSGWAVSVQPDWDPRHGSDFAVPRVGEIIIALEDAYQNHRGDAAMRAAAVAKASNWAADKVFDEHWRPILADFEAQLSEKPNRAQRRAKRKGRAA